MNAPTTAPRTLTESIARHSEHTVALAPHGTPSAIVAAFALAYQRAADAKMIAYKNADGSYSVPSSSEAGVEHRVRKTGRRWYDWSCGCKGGNHVACMHRAVAVHCAKYHVHAVRPSSADASTPEDVELSEEIKREVLADLLNAQAIAAHTFQPGSSTLIQTSRPNPFSGIWG